MQLSARSVQVASSQGAAVSRPPVVPCRTLLKARSTRSDGQRGTSTVTSSPEPESPKESWTEKWFPAQPGRKPVTPPPVINVVVPTEKKKGSVLPDGVPIIHSSVYLTQTLQSRLSTTSPDSDGDIKSLPPVTSTGTVRVKRVRVRPELSEEELGKNAIERALRRADASLDELEANPMPIQKVVYAISKGPVGQATGAAVQVSAQLVVEAAKKAAPVGKWALSEGFKLASGLVKTAVMEGMKAEGRRQAAEEARKKQER